MYEIIVKKRLRASHALFNYRGSAERIHSHNWLIEARFASRQLDKSGCAVDFLEVDRILKKILVKFNNKKLNNFPAFRSTSPSTENFAKYIFRELKKMIKNKRIKVVSVCVWEDPDHGVNYYKFS